jgi:hypothetical protein
LNDSFSIGTMSTSPHERTARPASPTTAPPTPAELRSQAVAKLKRAASLPRTPNGRRPSQSRPAQSANAEERFYGDTPQDPSLDQHDHEELLSPSPTAAQYGHSTLYPPGSGTGMQRSVSASSSFGIPTPPHASGSGSPFFGASPSPTHPEWTAFQLAQSFLPSLSPGLNYGHAISPGQGRNTPSPLPSLGELGKLSRSNSVAARAKAMNKLTGGRETPTPPSAWAATDDHNLLGVRPNLQRADSLGAPRTLASSTSFPTPDHLPAPALTDVPSTRPRLQRSFTVSSTNMKKEERSAVGRRMLERLGERQAARQDDQAEVRRLWEERGAGKAAERGQEENRHGQEHAGDEKRSARPDHQDASPDSPNHSNRPHPTAQIPVLAPPLHSLLAPDTHAHAHAHSTVEFDSLPVPDERAVSRGTMRSEGEAFEFDSESLRRSLSGRTAGNGLEMMPNITRSPPDQEHGSEQLYSVHHRDSGGEDEGGHAYGTMHDNEADLPPPLAPFATSTGHVTQDSTSTQGTIRGHHLRDDSTISAGPLGTVGVAGQSALTASVSSRSGEGNWPSEVHEGGSDWGTPARTHGEL